MDQLISDKNGSKQLLLTKSKLYQQQKIIKADFLNTDYEKCQVHKKEKSFIKEQDISSNKNIQLCCQRCIIENGYQPKKYKPYLQFKQEQYSKVIEQYDKLKQHKDKRNNHQSLQKLQEFVKQIQKILDNYKYLFQNYDCVFSQEIYNHLFVDAFTFVLKQNRYHKEGIQVIREKLQSLIEYRKKEIEKAESKQKEFLQISQRIVVKKWSELIGNAGYQINEGQVNGNNNLISTYINQEIFHKQLQQQIGKILKENQKLNEQFKKLKCKKLIKVQQFQNQFIKQQEIIDLESQSLYSKVSDQKFSQNENKLQKQLDNLKAILTQRQAQIKKLLEQIKKKDQEINEANTDKDVKIQLKEIQKQQQVYSKIQNMNKKSRENLYKVEADYKQKISQKQSQIQTLKQYKIKVEKLQKQYSQALNKKNQEIQTMTVQNKILINKKQEEIKNIKSELIQYKNNIEKLNEQIKELNNRQQSILKQLSELRTLSTTKKQFDQQYHNQRQQFKKKIKKLQKQKQQIERKAQNKFKDFQKQINTISKEKQQIQKLKMDEQKLLTNLKIEFEQLKKQNKGNKQRIVQQTEKFKKSIEKQQKLKIQLSESQTKINNLAVKVEDSQNQINRLTQQLKSYQTKLKQLLKKEQQTLQISNQYFQLQTLSKIATYILEKQQTMVLFGFLNNTVKPTRLKLTFSARQHAFSEERFHFNCQDLSTFIVIVKCQNGKIFGGYSEFELGSNKISTKSFIFSITHKVMMNIKPNKKATVKDLAYGPIFGEGDFKIKKKQAYSNHHIYNSAYERKQIPQVLLKELLCGGLQTSIIDYQVHQIIF